MWNELVTFHKRTVSRSCWWTETLSELAREWNRLQLLIKGCGLGLCSYPDPSDPIYLKSWETKNRKRHLNLTLGHRAPSLGGTTPFCVWVNFVNPKIRQRHLLSQMIVPQLFLLGRHLVDQKDLVSPFTSQILLWTRVDVTEETFLSLILYINGNHRLHCSRDM